MSNLLTALSHLHRGNVKTNNFLPLSERDFSKLRPWPEPKSVPVRALRPFGRLDVMPNNEQLSRAAAALMRCCTGPVIVDDDSEVLLGQLRVAALKKHFGPRSRVDVIRVSELADQQLAFIVRKMFSLIYEDGWDYQMLSIDCQGLSAFALKTGAMARTHARRRVVAHEPGTGFAIR